MREAEDRCRYNFLDPNYGFSYTAEQAEHYQELMANFGYEEAGTGDYIKYAIECFSKIGRESNYRDGYISFLEGILHDVDVLKSKEETKGECRKWISDALSQLKL